MMGYDQQYTHHAHLFSAEPSDLLVEHVDSIDRDAPVLDIGAGQGRNVWYLASRGLRVVAIDPSRVAAESLARGATTRGIPVTALHQGFEEHEAAPGSYGSVLAFGLLPILSRAQIAVLAARAHNWLAKGGLLFITGFTTRDPRFAEISAAHPCVERNSYLLDDGQLRTYLEPGELPALFAGLTVAHLWEGLGPEHRHGDGPPERHAWVEAVLLRGS